MKALMTRTEVDGRIVLVGVGAMTIGIICHGIQAGTLRCGADGYSGRSSSHICEDLEELHSHLVSLLAEAARGGGVPASGAQTAHRDSSGTDAQLPRSEAGALPAQAWRGRLDWQDRARPQDWDLEREPGGVV